MYGESTESWLLAIVVPELEQLKKGCSQREITIEGLGDDELVAQEDVHKMVIENFNELAKSNKLNGIEKIKKIFMTNEAFSMDNDILTPTFKIKRNIARKIF